MFLRDEILLILILFYVVMSHLTFMASVCVQNMHWFSNNLHIPTTLYMYGDIDTSYHIDNVYMFSLLEFRTTKPPSFPCT